MTKRRSEQGFCDNHLTRRLDSSRLLGHRDPKSASLGGISVWRLIALTLVSVLLNINTAQANVITKSDLILYAYNKMNWQNFECYNWLIRKESGWDPSARNGSHYGLAQMRNAKVARLNGYQQIEWHIRYLAHRYKGDACLALRHSDRYGWH